LAQTAKSTSGILIGIFSAASTRSLRIACVHSLTVSPDWWTQQFPALEDRATPASYELDQSRLPDFLSREHNQMFLPDQFDAGMSNYR
jgi:hypothetical protein